jgi:hypothetical protein
MPFYAAKVWYRFLFQVQLRSFLASGTAPASTKLTLTRTAHLRKIDGFEECGSLSRLEIPASIEAIGPSAFSGCSGLREVVFEADSHLRQMKGFDDCASLIQIDIPASVEIIGSWALFGCSGLREVVFEADSHVRQMEGFKGCVSLIRMIIQGCGSELLAGPRGSGPLLFMSITVT